MIHSVGVRVSGSDRVEEFVVTMIEAASSSSCPTTPSPTFPSSKPSASTSSVRAKMNSKSGRSLELVEESLGSLGGIPRVIISNVDHGLESHRGSLAKRSEGRPGPLRRRVSPRKTLTPEDLGHVKQSADAVRQDNSGTSSAEPVVPTSSAAEQDMSTFHLRKPSATETSQADDEQLGDHEIAPTPTESETPEVQQEQVSGDGDGVEETGNLTDPDERASATSQAKVDSALPEQVEESDDRASATSQAKLDSALPEQVEESDDRSSATSQAKLDSALPEPVEESDDRASATSQNKDSPPLPEQVEEPDNRSSATSQTKLDSALPEQEAPDNRSSATSQTKLDSALPEQEAPDNRSSATSQTKLDSPLPEQVEDTEIELKDAEIELKDAENELKDGEIELKDAEIDLEPVSHIQSGLKSTDTATHQREDEDAIGNGEPAPRVHHFHHHSHHHHHYYHPEFNQCLHSLPHMHCHQERAGKSGIREPDDDDDDGDEDHPLNASFCDASHHHHPVEHYCFPTTHDLQDLSFYRKFSATSPSRSKSSMAWAGGNVSVLNELNMLTNLCSTSKKQKSRSTPLRLDVMALSPSDQYGCSCGGCYYCCNAMSCSCCCDECCCARQSSHLFPPEEEHQACPLPNSTGNSSKTRRSRDGRSRRSLSLESVAQYDNSGIEMMNEDILNNSESAFLQTHLLSQLDNSDNSDDDDDDGGDDDDNDYVETMESVDASPEVVQHSSALNFANVGGDSGEEVPGSGSNGGIVDDKPVGMSEALEQPQTTNIVIIRRRKPAGDSRSRRTRASRTMVRVATGGIHTTPSLQSPNGGGVVDGTGGDGRSATMTLTVDTMSLFLDAVHLQVKPDE